MVEPVAADDEVRTTAERGPCKTEYAPGTFREKLLGTTRIPEAHRAGTFRR